MVGGFLNVNALIVGKGLFEFLLLLRRLLAEYLMLELGHLFVMGLILGRFELNVAVSPATARVSLKEAPIVRCLILA